MKKIIVIGGLSAGPSAAVKARRECEFAEITLFEKGSDISYATCGMPYAFSGVIEDRNKLLVVETDLLKDRFNINLKLNEEIVKIDTNSKVVYSNKGTYDYDKLIFATGARSIVPPIKNLEKASNWSTCRSMNDFDKIMNEGLAEASKNITIIGAGLIGVEVAENLVKAGKNVTLIEGDTSILNMWQTKFGKLASIALENKGVSVLTSAKVKEVNLTNYGTISSLVLLDGTEIETDFVIISAGIKPNTDLLLKEGANHIENGAITVDEFLQTSIKDVYAAGDNVAIKNLQTNNYGYFPLGTHSNKAGRAAGANAVGKQLSFKGAYNTAIVKVFDYTLARTGLNEKFLKANNYKYKTVLSVAGSTPGYYPGQKDLISEIYFNPDTEEIYGAEFFGEVGVDKRVDVLSTAIYAKLKITDLSQLDLAYAPPFSPAKDPVVVSGHIAENIVLKKANQISVNELEEIILKNQLENYLVLDVRTENEFNQGTIKTAVNIPLEQIRSNIDFVKQFNKPIILVCRRGMRAYLAELILSQNNVTSILNLAGGYNLWKSLKGTCFMPEPCQEQII